jgi:asparagine synthase (glutamine-hydrolysing)
MSVLFGEWNFDGKRVDPELLPSADAILSAYAPDALSHYYGDGIVLAYHALHTTAESRCEKQPLASVSGAVLSWDGRLDNREDLVSQLSNTVTNDTTDVEIVAAAFDCWGTACFAKILGDWAGAIWDPSQRQLILAKDFAGIRPLYYLVEGRRVRWSSVIDPLVILAGKKFKFNEEYAAGWLSMYPAAYATPYVGINAVPPCSLVTIDARDVKVTKYWDFDPCKKIRYRTDAEYEEHFRTAFREAVASRLRADRPICCELSGGMDSPSVTCMADSIAASSARIPEIYTLSYYNDSEPHGDERQYFSKVEEKRGHTGCHIDLAESQTLEIDSTADLWLTPAQVSSQNNSAQHQRMRFQQSHAIRVVLSGTGGDEMTGGVPTPTPELQDLIVRRELRQLAHMLQLWALAKRKPWIHLLAEAIRGFLPSSIARRSRKDRAPSWLLGGFNAQFEKFHRALNPQISVRGSLPSFQENINALETLRRQIATKELASVAPTETRYPFLDRSFLEFLFAIPREQVIRPGYRRSLMRRALAGIVPAEILERRRKAYASRGPRLAISAEANRNSGLAIGMEVARLGLVNEESFREAIHAAKNRGEIPFIPLSRTLVLEAWLRNVQRHQILMIEETQLPPTNIPQSAYPSTSQAP